jgi:hypothetical protein
VTPPARFPPLTAPHLNDFSENSVEPCLSLAPKTVGGPRYVPPVASGVPGEWCRQLTLDGSRPASTRAAAQEEAIRFHAKVVVDPRSGGCHHWIGAIGDDGYGRFPAGTGPTARTVRVHRWTFEVSTGLRPARRTLLHTCDETGCVALDHSWSAPRPRRGRDAPPRPRLAPAHRPHRPARSGRAVPGDPGCRARRLGSPPRLPPLLPPATRSPPSWCCRWLSRVWSRPRRMSPASRPDRCIGASSHFLGGFALASRGCPLGRLTAGPAPASADRFSPLRDVRRRSPYSRRHRRRRRQPPGTDARAARRGDPADSPPPGLPWSAPSPHGCAVGSTPTTRG